MGNISSKDHPSKGGMVIPVDHGDVICSKFGGRCWNLHTTTYGALAIHCHPKDPPYVTSTTLHARWDSAASESPPKESIATGGDGPLRERASSRGGPQRHGFSHFV